MLNKTREVAKLKHNNTRTLSGVTTEMLGEHVVVTVHKDKASFKGVPYNGLNLTGRQEYEDLLYIAHVQRGNPVIRYT